MSNLVNLNDTFKCSDNTKGMFRTKVIAGYDPFVDKNGVTRFGEVVFERSNMIVLGGSTFALEKLFGKKLDDSVDYLDNFIQAEDETFQGISNGNTTSPSISYPEDGTVVCLFGAGIGGASETGETVYAVNYNEREINKMIPFRQTSSNTLLNDGTYYFMKPVTINGETKYRYYLKAFDESEIKVLYESTVAGQDGNPVTLSSAYSSANTTSVETFVELTFKITQEDFREYFAALSTQKTPYINSIGLFTAVKQGNDYRQVKLFSKLNFNNEYLNAGKDMTIKYRIYTN